VTLRAIAHHTGIKTDNAVKVWKKQHLGEYGSLDAVLPAEKVEQFLTWLSTPATRRTEIDCQPAAELLAEFRAGKHQNGHTERITVKPPAMPAVERKVRQPKAAPVAIPEPAKQARQWPVISMLDIVYLSTIATAVYGLWFTLREMGAAFAVPYCLICFHALRMAKNPESRRTAQIGVGAVVVLEVLTFFVHLVLFNLRAVQAAKAGILPFEYSFWGSTEMPFTIACIFAGLFSGAGIYAVAVTFSLTSEKHAAAEKAKRDVEQKESDYAVIRAALEDSAKRWAVASGQNHFDPGKAGEYAERYFHILNETK